MKEENKNYLEKAGQSIRNSVTLKLISIFILMLLLLIPMDYVKDVIQDREDLRQQTVVDVSNKWANEQYVYGPILSIPVQKTILKDEKTVTVDEVLHILPDKLLIDGRVAPKKLNRGIYEVVVYDSQLSFSGHFENISEYLRELKEYTLNLDDAFLTVHISDLRGIKEKVVVKWNDQARNIDPGSGIPTFVKSGITVKNVLRAEGPESYKFSFDLKLQGSQYLGFVPLGKETDVKLSSDWQDPSFTGSFLPDNRKVDEQGFAANWKVLELNRNFPQYWIGDRNVNEVIKSSFGVEMLLPVNDYQKSMRSAKYALLAISLTFLTFFLVEIFNKKKVHPFQYILIGLALCLFYTLLVSISEHSNFNLAYLISSVVIIGIIGLYAKSILPSAKQAAMLVLILCFTYTFVYVTLQVQDYALLIGSVGLTAILAFTMFITRNVNWYDLSSTKASLLPNE